MACCSKMIEGPVRCALMSGLVSQRLLPLLAMMAVRLRVGHQTRRRAHGTQGSSAWPDPSRRRTSSSRGTAPSARSTEHAHHLAGLDALIAHVGAEVVGKPSASLEPRRQMAPFFLRADPAWRRSCTTMVKCIYGRSYPLRGRRHTAQCARNIG